VQGRAAVTVSTLRAARILVRHFVVDFRPSIPTVGADAEDCRAERAKVSVTAYLTGDLVLRHQSRARLHTLQRGCRIWDIFPVHHNSSMGLEMLQSFVLRGQHLFDLGQQSSLVKGFCRYSCRFFLSAGIT